MIAQILRLKRTPEFVKWLIAAGEIYIYNMNPDAFPGFVLNIERIRQQCR